MSEAEENKGIDSKALVNASSRIVELLGSCSFKGEDADKVLQIRQLAVAIANEAQRAEQAKGQLKQPGLTNGGEDE